jgi:hypothetical protein
VCDARPLFKDFWERFLWSLEQLRVKGQRTVYRLTLVKQWNMEEIDNYVNLIGTYIITHTITLHRAAEARDQGRGRYGDKDDGPDIDISCDVLYQTRHR